MVIKVVVVYPVASANTLAITARMANYKTGIKMVLDGWLALFSNLNIPS